MSSALPVEVHRKKRTGTEQGNITGKPLSGLCQEKSEGSTKRERHLQKGEESLNRVITVSHLVTIFILWVILIVSLLCGFISVPFSRAIHLKTSHDAFDLLFVNVHVNVEKSTIKLRFAKDKSYLSGC